MGTTSRGSTAKATNKHQGLQQSKTRKVTKRKIGSQHKSKRIPDKLVDSTEFNDDQEESVDETESLEEETAAQQSATEQQAASNNADRPPIRSSSPTYLEHITIPGRNEINWTDDILDLAIQKFKNRTSYKQIAAQLNTRLGVTVFTASKVQCRIDKARKDGVSIPSRHRKFTWTATLMDLLFQKYKDGIKYKEIAEQLNKLPEVNGQLDTKMVSIRLEKAQKDGEIPLRGKRKLKMTTEMNEKIMEGHRAKKPYKQIAEELNEDPDFEGLMTHGMVSVAAQKAYKDYKAESRFAQPAAIAMHWNHETLTMLADTIKENPGCAPRIIIVALANRKGFPNRNALSKAQLATGRKLARQQGLLDAEHTKPVPISTTEAIALTILVHRRDEITALAKRSFKKSHARVMMHFATTKNIDISRYFARNPKKWRLKVKERSPESLEKTYPGYLDESVKKEIDDTLSHIIEKVKNESVKCTRCKDKHRTCSGKPGPCDECILAQRMGGVQTKDRKLEMHECSYRESLKVQVVYPLSTSIFNHDDHQDTCHDCCANGLECDGQTPCSNCKETGDGWTISQCNPVLTHNGYRRYKEKLVTNPAGKNQYRYGNGGWSIPGYAASASSDDTSDSESSLSSDSERLFVSEDEREDDEHVSSVIDPALRKK